MSDDDSLSDAEMQALTEMLSLRGAVIERACVLGDVHAAAVLCTHLHDLIGIGAVGGALYAASCIATEGERQRQPGANFGFSIQIEPGAPDGSGPTEQFLAAARFVMAAANLDEPMAGAIFLAAMDVHDDTAVIAELLTAIHRVGAHGLDWLAGEPK